MKKNKTKLILCIAIGMSALVCLSLVLYRSINREDKIKLGMSLEETVTILEKQNYSYELRDLTDSYGKTIIYVKEVVFRGIEGRLYIDVDLDDQVYEINYMSDMADEKITVLDKYLAGLYGKPIYNEVTSNAYNIQAFDFYKDDMVISYSYPADSNSLQPNIAIGWYYSPSSLPPQ